MINTGITVVISVFISTLSAYGFARIDFPGRETLFKLYLFTLMVPSFLNIIPQFIILKGMHLPWSDESLIGTRAGLILVYVATNVCGHTFFLRNFFRGLPDALSESVIVDGGGHGTIFFRVMLPLSKPAIRTMSIFALQGFWEEYFTAKVLVGASEDMITLPLLLQRLHGQYSTRWEWVFAASILALIPVIALFIIFQRKMVIGGLTQVPSRSNDMKQNNMETAYCCPDRRSTARVSASASSCIPTINFRTSFTFGCTPCNRKLNVGGNKTTI